MELTGVGSSLGSWLLMARDPARYTVFDPRARRSIRAVGYGHQVAESRVTRNWLPYLDACRQVRDRTGCDLRTVDRAMFKADGTPDPPPAS